VHPSRAAPWGPIARRAPQAPRAGRRVTAPRGPALRALALAAGAGDAASLRRLHAALRAALTAVGGTRAEAARALGISTRTLLRWLAEGGVAASVGREVPATLGWRAEQREGRSA